MTRKIINATAAVLLIALAAISAQAFWMVIIVWCVLSVIAVSLAYAFNWAKVFRKSSDGSIPPLTRLLFMPFLFATTIYNAGKRLHDRAPPFQKIIDDLYVGARLTSADINHLKEQQIHAVLDVTAEFDGLGQFADEEHAVDYLNIPVLDHAVPTQSQLVHACRWIHEHRKHGHSVLVHCALGRGRSVLFAASYLIAIGEASDLDTAIDHIQGIRLTANLNKRQTRKVEKWLKEELGDLILRNRAYLIANPVAGSGQWEDVRDGVVEYLSRYFILDIQQTTPEYSAAEAATHALRGSPDLIIACGGDGTLNEIANIVAGTGVPLGILPLGTANAVAQSFLGWEARFNPVDTACQAIVDGHVKKIDTATCNGERMLLAVGLGIEDHMVRNTSREEKNRLGALAYVQSFFDGLSSGDALCLNITYDDEPTHKVNTRSLVVANAAPPTSILSQGQGKPLPDDGHLDITIVLEGEGLSDDIAAVGSLALSALTNSPAESRVLYRRAKRIRIQSDNDLPYIIDGETRQAKSIEVSIEPRSLLLYAPRDPEPATNRPARITGPLLQEE